MSLRKMLVKIFIVLFSALIFLFLFWRRLKEDYPANIIFTTSFYILVGLALGRLMSARFLPLWWFWAETLGALTGLAVGLVIYKMRFFESCEAAGIAFLPWLSLTFLADSVKNSSLSSFAAFVATIILLGLFFYLDSRYKAFAWYKSGRVGFAGLATLGLFFLFRTAFAVFFPSVLSFIGRNEAFVSGTAAFILFLLVYNLAKEV